MAVTEVSVVLWHKHDWTVAGRLKYWSEGQPYLHLVGDLLVVPGATKYTARLLLYDRQAGSLHRVRDLVHTKVWVVDTWRLKFEFLKLVAFVDVT